MDPLEQLRNRDAITQSRKTSGYSESVVPAPENRTYENSAPPVVSERQSEEIKRTYSTNPEVYAPINGDEIRKSAREINPGITGTDLALGAIPLAISALMGGNGAGAEVGAKYYTGLEAKDRKRTQTLEDKLIDLELKRRDAAYKQSLKSTTSSKMPTKSNLVEVVDKDGNVTYQWAGEAAGMHVPRKEKTGLTLEDRLKIEDHKAGNRKTRDQEKRALDAGIRFQKTLDSDPQYKDFTNQLSQSQRALDLLSQGKGVADAGARTTFAKGIFGEVGNLAIQEQMAVSGSPALRQKWETLLTKWNEGTIGDADRADMIEVAAAIRDYAPLALKKITEKRALAEKEISGVDVSHIGNYLSKDTFTKQTTTKIVYEGRVYEIPVEKFPEAVKKGAKLFTGKAK